MYRRIFILAGLICMCIFPQVFAQTVEPSQSFVPFPALSNSHDYFGMSVSIDGDYAVVGESGYNGNTGIVCVYHFNGAQWVKQAVLRPSDPEINAKFGISVAINGDVIAIGSYSSEKAIYGGAVYVFVKPSEGWTDTTESFKLYSTQPQESEFFGRSVKLTDKYLVVGATRTNIYTDTDTVYNSGAIYIFQKQDSTWAPKPPDAILLPQDFVGYGNFGINLDIWGNKVIAGQENYNSYKGIAYVFTLPENLDQDTILPDTALQNINITSWERFGGSVGIGDSICIVGAKGYSQAGNYYTGAVYIFRLEESGQWEQSGVLLSANPVNNSWLGYSVVYADSLIVASANTGNDLFSSGALFIYRKPANGWQDTLYENETIFEPHPAVYNYFGFSLAFNGTSILAGAHGNDSLGTDAGAAYFISPVRSWGISGVNIQTVFPQPYYNAAYEQMGNSIVTDGNYALVGAFGYNDYMGRAYLFHYSGEQWQRIATFYPGDSAGESGFGYSLDLQDNIAVVGAYSYSDDNYQKAGAVYVFINRSETDGQWTDTLPAFKITAPDMQSDQYFGYTVKIYDSIIAIGATKTDVNSNINQGSVYLYKLTPNLDSAILLQEIHAQNGKQNYYFGNSLDLNGNTLVVGEYMNSDYGSANGAVHIFRKTGTSWADSVTETVFYPADRSSGGFYGYRVKILGTRLAVSRFSSTVNGEPYSGSVYIYNPGTDGLWSDTANYHLLIPSDYAYYLKFGYNLTEYDNILLVSSVNKSYGPLYFVGKVYGYDLGQMDNDTVFENFAIEPVEKYYNENFGSALGISNHYFLIGAQNSCKAGTNSGELLLYKYPRIEENQTNEIPLCQGDTALISIQGRLVSGAYWQYSTDGRNYTFVDTADYHFQGSDGDTLLCILDSSMRDVYVRRFFVLGYESITSVPVHVFYSDEPPVLLCPGDTVSVIASRQGSYTVNGKELDPQVSSNCRIVSVYNSVNNDSTLAGYTFETGTYTVTWFAADENGNSDSCTYVLFVAENTDLHALAGGINVYPNPAGDLISIGNLPADRNIVVRLLDVNGRMILTKHLNQPDKSLNVKSLPQGIYILQVITGDKVYVRRIIKE